MKQPIDETGRYMWIVTSISLAYYSALQQAEDKLQRLLSEKHQSGSTFFHSDYLVTTLYASFRLRNGTLGSSRRDTDLERLLHRGVVTLGVDGDTTYLSDQIYIAAIENVFKSSAN